MQPRHVSLSIITIECDPLSLFVVDFLTQCSIIPIAVTLNVIKYQEIEEDLRTRERDCDIRNVQHHVQVH